MLTGNVGAKISGIDQTITQLLQDFRFNRTILLDRKETATDAALVRNDNKFEAIRFQTPQRFWDAGEDFHLLRVGTIINILHDRTIPIDKNGWSSCLGGGGHLDERDVAARMRQSWEQTFAASTTFGMQPILGMSVASIKMKGHF